MDRFFEEAWEASSYILIADTQESQSEGFDLVKWYESYDFKVVGHVGGLPVMVKY